MPPLPNTIAAPVVLAVEGEDECRFFQALLRTEARTDVQTIPVGGKHQLLHRVPAITLTPGFEGVRVLAVAQDADDNPRAAIDRIKGALRRAGLPEPSAPWQPTGSSPMVVALVWPDGTRSGDLETMVLEALRADATASATITCVDAFFDSRSAAQVPLPRQLAKAKLHAYLATQSKPDLHMGTAAEAGVLRVQGEPFDRILQLLSAPTV